LKRDGEVQLVGAADGLVAVGGVRYLGRSFARIFKPGFLKQILYFMPTKLWVVVDERAARVRFSSLAVLGEDLGPKL
jgi:hypothetical protein